MSTRNLDFFSTFLDGGRRTSYEPTAASVKRTILEALAQSNQMTYNALWKEASAYGVPATLFTRAVVELRDGEAILIVRDAADASNPLVALTPAGVIATSVLTEVE